MVNFILDRREHKLFVMQILSVVVKIGGENVKKRKSLTLLAILFVTVLTGVVVFNTVAKYTSEVTKNGSVTVAKWDFANDNAGSTYSISIAPTAAASTLVNGKIAPGTSGSFDISIVNTNSEVGAEVTVALGNVTAANSGTVPSGLKFYSDNAFQNEITPGTFTKTGKLIAGDSTGLSTTIYWKWEYEVDAAGNTADTTAGLSGSGLTIPVTITGTQLNPTTATFTSAWN